MLIVKIVTEEGERELPIASDGDWAIDSEGGYLIVKRVDGVRAYYPLVSLVYWEIGPLK